MNEQIIFTLKELLIGILYVLAITGALIKLAYSMRRMKRNDLEGFLKKDDFQEFKEEYIRVTTELQRDVEYLKEAFAKFNKK